MTNERKYWIEIYHPGQVRPSLQEITGMDQEQLRATIRQFDDLHIPWAFGCGDRMPDQVDWRKP